MGGFGSFSGGGLGMGVAFSLRDYFTNTSKKIKGEMVTLSAQTDVLAASVTKAYKRIAIGAAVAGAGILGLGIFKKASAVRADFQAYVVQFTTLLGSAKKASKFFAQIKKDAVDNPIFGTESLVAANAALVSTGKVAEEQSRRVVNNLAEILAGVGKGDTELLRMSANLQQIGNNGKASEKNIKQFSMAGVPIMKVLADSMGTTTDKIAGMDITLEELDKAFQHATSAGQMFHGATDRAAESTKGLQAALDDSFTMIEERLGKAIEPITRKFYKTLGKVADKLLEFISTPAGQRFATWAFYGSILLIVLGGTLLVMGLLRVGILALIKTYPALLREKLLDIVATEGLTAALWEMAVAAWASIGPYIIIAAIILVVAYGIYKAIKMLGRGRKELEKPIGDMATTGVLGFFTKMAAMIKVVRQLWQSWDGETGHITKDLRDRLEKLGLLGFAEKVGAVVVRIKQLWNGLKEGVAPIKEVLKKLGGKVWDRLVKSFNRIRSSLRKIKNSVKKAFGPLMPILRKIFDKLFGVSGEMSTLKVVGKLVGEALILPFRIWAWLMGGIVDLILDIIDALVWLFTKYLQFEVWLNGKISQFLAWIVGKVEQLWAWLTALPGRMAKAGSNMMQKFWDGIKSIWALLATWIDTKVSQLVKGITDPISKAWKYITTGGGLWGGDGNPDEPRPNAAPAPQKWEDRAVTYHMKHTTKSPVVINKVAASQAQATNLSNITIPIFMDGDKIGEKVIERQKLSNSRDNDMT